MTDYLKPANTYSLIPWRSGVKCHAHSPIYQQMPFAVQRVVARRFPEPWANRTQLQLAWWCYSSARSSSTNRRSIEPGSSPVGGK